MAQNEDKTSLKSVGAEFTFKLKLRFSVKMWDKNIKCKQRKVLG